jgi:peptidoglycan/LPS O-acetylase OafA/YrhL
MVYQLPSRILISLWSLEIEMHFYLLAPLFMLVFKLKNAPLRWFVYFSYIAISYLIKHNFVSNNFTLFSCLYYFVGGMMLSEVMILHANRFRFRYDFLMWVFAGISLFFVSFTFFGYMTSTVKFISSLVFFYYSFVNKLAKKILSISIITTIGGMCYSIYIIHMGVVLYFNPYIENIVNFKNHQLDSAVNLVLLSSTIMLFSTLLYVLVERPTMKKDWYKKLNCKTKADC